MDYKKRSHSVYSLTYHLVFVTKYRKPVISDEIGDFMKKHASYLCGRFDGSLLAAETDTDHIHLAVELFDDLLYFIMRSNINDNGNPRYIRVFCCSNRDTFDIDLTSRQDSCKAIENT